MGENQLAHWLCVPSSREAILERHSLIRELRDKLDLREDLALTSEDLRTRLNPESLVGWAEGQRVLPKSRWRTVAVALALCSVAAILYYFAGGPYRIALIFLAVDAIFLRALKKRAQAVIHGVSCNAEGLLLFSRILHRLEREPLASPRLRTFSAELTAEGRRASPAIRKLARIVYWIDAEHSLLAHLAELPLLYTIQLAFAAEAWRSRFGQSMRRWVEITGEVEALLSLAAYAFEHPADAFPDFVNAGNPAATFHAEELGHPLIPAARCVRNNVRLDHDTRVLLVSGSNMSGKSTLLRAVGINAVLAMAGAPVRAQSLRLTPLAIGTCIRSTDSLQEGRSGFYTEILHIRAVFDLADGADLPLLFLFDELLEGTNSKDRRIGAEGLLQALLGRGAIGIVTTHDLALTEIGQSLGPRLCNMHFQDYVEKMHIAQARAQGLPDLGQRQVVRCDNADRSPPEQRLKQTLGANPAIFGVGSFKQFVKQEQQRKVSTVGRVEHSADVQNLGVKAGTAFLQGIRAADARSDGQRRQPQRFCAHRSSGHRQNRVDPDGAQKRALARHV